METNDAVLPGGEAVVDTAHTAQEACAAGTVHPSSTPPADGAGMFTQAFWDERYGARTQLWSGNPNPQLVSQTASLRAGRALDVGCGEGADAIWLAQRGWQVTAVDISAVALARGARRAAEAAAEVAARIVWRQEDVLTWGPEPGVFDLISAQFMHLPPAPRAALFRRLAGGVVPGGTLLIVGHHHMDRHGPQELLFTASEIAGLLPAEHWEILVEATLARSTTNAAGDAVTMHDAVLRAQRRA